MATLSNAEAALLGLLSEEPMYPYQIEQQVQYRDMRFWTELSMSSIYKLLRKLEKDGMVECSKEVSEENRLRKLYSISEEGKKALAEKLEALLSEPEHVRWQIDIATYNCDLLPEKTVRQAMKKYRKELEKQIKWYEELRQFLQDSGCPAHRMHIANRAIFLIKGDIQWVDEFLSTL